MNRRPRLSAPALGFGLALIALSTPARADALPANGTGVASYELTAAAGLPVPDPSANAPQVVLDVTNGQIVPPTSSSGTTSSPLTILGSSSGLDQNNLIVGLKDVTPAAADGATQQFGLSFFKTGLLSEASGGKLDFQLTVNPALPTPTLISETPGVTVSPYTVPTVTPTVTPTTTPAATGSGTVGTPEPASLALWSLVAGLGALRVRSYRRRRAATAAA